MDVLRVKPNFLQIFFFVIVLDTVTRKNTLRPESEKSKQTVQLPTPVKN